MMEEINIDACVTYLISTCQITLGKDPESCVERLVSLNPSIKLKNWNAYLEIYRRFLEWWFMRSDYIANDLEHRVKTIMQYHICMIRRYLNPDAHPDNYMNKVPYGYCVVFDGKRYDAGILWDVLKGLIGKSLSKSIVELEEKK